MKPKTKLEIEIRKKEEEALLLDYSKMSLDEKEVFTQALIVSNQKLKRELSTINTQKIALPVPPLIGHKLKTPLEL